MTNALRVSVIIVAYGQEPTLSRCIKAAAESSDVQLEVVVVDNGADPASLAEIGDVPGVRIVGPPINRGFAAGCNVGARSSDGEVLVFLNSDAFVEPDAIHRLTEVAMRPGTGIATASLRLDQAPDRMNSAGNPVHFSGLSWAGAFGQPADQHDSERDVASASGAAMAIRRSVWEQLNGFDEVMFAYLEDADLSIRCWRRGLSVRFTPDAIVRHDYEFTRHRSKTYLLERNRLYLVLSSYEARTLLLLLPALLFLEILMVANALMSGWLSEKVRSWYWVLSNLDRIRVRRSDLEHTVPDAVWTHVLTSRISPGNKRLPPGMTLVNICLSGYWSAVRRLLHTKRSGRTGPTRRQDGAPDPLAARQTRGA